MRLVSLLVTASLGLAAACEAPAEPVPPRGDPDAAIAINCEGSFTFVAPRPELHYSTDLTVIADMDPFYASNLPGVECVDDLDQGYEPTAAPTSTTLDSGLVEMRWHFTLAPGRRYLAYFSATECDQTVEFFTSAP